MFEPLAHPEEDRDHVANDSDERLDSDRGSPPVKTVWKRLGLESHEMEHSCYSFPLLGMLEWLVLSENVKF